MPRSWLSARGVTGLAGLFGVVFILGSVAIGAAMYSFTEYELSRAEDGRIERERDRLLAPDHGVGPSTAAIARRIRSRAAVRGISNIGHRLTDPSGKLVAGTVEVRGVRAGDRNIEFRQAGGDWDPARAMSLTLPDGGHLMIVAESESVEDMTRIIWPIVLTTALLATLLGIAMSVLLGRLIAARLSATSATARAIIAGDYSRRVPIDSLGGLFAEQARTFNQMLNRIEELMDNLRQVSSDLAHDLRTSLTRLQGTMRDAASPGLDDDRRTALLQSAERESQGLLALFAALLRISEVEAGRRRSHARLLRLDELVEDVVETYVPSFADADRSLVLAERIPATIVGDADLLNQMLVNLVENAKAHTPPDSRTTVSILAGEAGPILVVRDDGPGIPERDRKDVFGRFVRLERSRSTPGHGLGLSLVNAVAKFHDARVELDDASPGLIVRIHFAAPVASDGAGPIF